MQLTHGITFGRLISVCSGCRNYMRRTMKKLILVLLAAVLLSVFTSCGDSDSGSEKTTSFQCSLRKNHVLGELALGILGAMTTEEKVGQMFFVRCRKDTAISDIEQYSPGGFYCLIRTSERKQKKH